MVAIAILVALVLPTAQAMVRHDESCCCPSGKAKTCPMRSKQSSCGMRSPETSVLVPLILRDPALITLTDAPAVAETTARFERELVASPRHVAHPPDSPPPR